MTAVVDATLNIALTANQVYTSSVCDLKGYNSLTAQVLLTWVEVVSPTTNIVFSFSPDNVNYDTNETFVITTGVGINLSMPIHSRFMKYVVSNPEATDMSVSRISAAVHVAPHQNIDVNLGEGDSLAVSGDFGLEITQLAVKGVLDNIKTNTDKLPRTGDVIYSDATITAATSTTPIDMGGYNVIQVSGRVPFDSSYNFVLQFGRAEVGNYFSDGIEPDIKRLGTTAFATFSLTRTNIAHRYVRLYNLVGGSEVFLEYDLLKN